MQRQVYPTSCCFLFIEEPSFGSCMLFYDFYYMRNQFIIKSILKLLPVFFLVLFVVYVCSGDFGNGFHFN